MNAIQAGEILAELKNLLVSWRLKSPLVFHCMTAVLLAFFLAFRLSVTIPIVIFFIGGFSLGLLLLSPDSLFPNLLWIYNRTKKIEKEEKVNSCHVCGKQGCGRHRLELNIQSLQPWINMEIPEKVNEALEEFFNIVFKEYIHSWYNDLSSDESFVDEMKVSIRFAVSVIYRRLRKVDIPSFISNQVLHLSLKHLHNCLKVIRSRENSPSEAIIPAECKRPSSESNPSTRAEGDAAMTASQILQQQPKGSKTPGNPPRTGSRSTSSAKFLCGRVLKKSVSGDLSNPTNDLEQLILDSYGHHLHCAARTRRSELDYLKQVVEKLFLYVVPPNNLKSRSFTSFMKELVTGVVLLPAMDVIGDPDIINNLLILYFDKSPLEECKDPASSKVPILQGFSQRSPSFQNQRNLQLKLSAVLSDPDLLFAFMQFMKAEASVNVLQFYLFIEEFNRKVLTPELTPEKLEELHRELQDNKCYFDPQNPDCIRFDSDITSQITEICEGPPDGIIKLQTTTPLFRAYEQAYDLLEHNFLPLFHQSDIYYTMLCGERVPSKLNRSNSRVTKRGSTVDSLARLSSRLKCVFKSNAVDGRPICDDDDDEVEQVGDPLMNEEFFLQAPNGTSGRQPESPVNLGGDESSYLLTTGNGGSDSQEENPPRDLSLWVVSIPSILTKVDPSDPNNPKKYFYVFKVEIKRLAEERENTDAFEPEEWSIERRYHEFYVLETKLREFHGDFEDAQLPPKKTFVPKTKTFFETLRPNFESFLRILLTKPNLKGSQLVHSFLTSDLEFTTSFLDVNLGKKVKSGAMKLVKERGQHLEPFLKSFLQSIEYQKPKAAKQTDRDSDTLSISSEKMINSIFNNNANIEDLPVPISDPGFMLSSDEAQGSYFDALLYLSHSLFKASDWMMQLLLSMRIIFRNTVDAFLDSFISKKLDQALSEHYVVKIIHLLRDALFFDNEPIRTDEDRKVRQMKAFEELVDYIPNMFVKAVGAENFEQGIRLIFDLLQQPRLNKQLSYVLLDAVLEELFPELSRAEVPSAERPALKSRLASSSDGRTIKGV